jgi:hypothetical protein
MFQMQVFLLGQHRTGFRWILSQSSLSVCFNTSRCSVEGQLPNRRVADLDNALACHVIVHVVGITSVDAPDARRWMSDADAEKVMITEYRALHSFHHRWVLWLGSHKDTICCNIQLFVLPPLWFRSRRRYRSTTPSHSRRPTVVNMDRNTFCWTGLKTNRVDGAELIRETMRNNGFC